MYDGRTDEQVFGAPYDFVELYLLYISMNDEVKKKEIDDKWCEAATNQFNELKERIEALHSYNKHKYIAKSPAVHLDILESNVPGGWTNVSPYQN